MLSPEASATPQRRQRGPVGRIAVLVACALGLAACSSGDGAGEIGTIGAVTGFAGMVAADEPHAALAARDILSAGGTAADAAVAGAFTMAVTLPSSAGILGGGMCLVHGIDDDADRSKVEVLEFLPGFAPADGATRFPAAVPGLPRGLFALHAKYGVLRWESLLAPAEQMARLGFPASRALAKEFVAGGAVLRNDMEAIRTFADREGMSPGEGTRLVQENLGASIARIRMRGVGDFYQGVMARDLVAAYRRVGFGLTVDALRDYRPRWLEPATTMRGNEIVAVPPDGVPGTETLQVYNAVAGGTAQPQQGGQPLPGASGIIAVDKDGGAVSCVLMMNGPFGAGGMAPGTGMLIAAPPPYAGTVRQPIGLLMAVNSNVKEFYFAGAAGGAGAASSIGRIAGQVLTQGVDLPTALSNAISGRDEISGLVNAASCTEGMPPNPESCRVVTDSRSSGYGMVVGRK